jgi:hypothetical protein
MTRGGEAKLVDSKTRRSIGPEDIQDTAAAHLVSTAQKRSPIGSHYHRHLTSLKAEVDAQVDGEGRSPALEAAALSAEAVLLNKGEAEAAALRGVQQTLLTKLRADVEATLRKELGLRADQQMPPPAEIANADRLLCIGHPEFIKRDLVDVTLRKRRSTCKTACVQGDKDALNRALKDHKLEIVTLLYDKYLDENQLKKLATLMQIDHIRSASSDHVVNLCLMPKYVNQHYGEVRNQTEKALWATPWGFERATELVYELARVELAILRSARESEPASSNRLVPVPPVVRADWPRATL